MSSRLFPVSIGVLLAWIAALCLVRGEAEAGSNHEERAYRFEFVGLHDPLEHTFSFENPGPDDLELGNVSVTAPLELVKATSKVSPGKTGLVTVRLGEPRKKGVYEGQVELAFKDPEKSHLVFRLAGRIGPGIECVPMPAFFVSTQRGEPKRASIQIINHEKEPVDIIRVEHASSRFTTELETVERGQRYTLSLDLKGDGKAGRLTEPITLVTSSKRQPEVKIQANTLIKERVYAFPDTLDLGLIRKQ